MSPPRQPFFSRLSVRLLALGLLLVFLPAGGFFYLDVYERQLLEAQERSMVQQGRLLAATLSGGNTLDATTAEAILRRLEQRTEARLRIYGPGLEVLADSARLGPQARPPENPYASAKPETRDSLVYRGGAAFYRAWRRLTDREPPPRSKDAAPVDPHSPLPEVRQALTGRYGAAARPTPADPRVFTLHSAIPVRGGPSGQEVIGAVLVSQSTYRILNSLVEVRSDIFRVFLISVAAAVILSLLVSATIDRPLRRLREEANALVDARGRLRGSFRGTDRQDEIGHLTRALEQLTHRFDEHLRFAESFAADVSHELKNPLATIRTATEMLAEVDDPEDRKRFLGIAQREVARMERLLSAMREITEIDAHLDAEPAIPVDLSGLLRQVIESLRLRSTRLTVELRAPDSPVFVSGSPERLSQVFGNVLDNAASFSPQGGTIQVTLSRENGNARVSVADSGAGIPEAHLVRLFDRFFTYRPGEPQGRNGHTGLGLAIVKAIVEGYGGAVSAANRSSGGAQFDILLPTLDGKGGRTDHGRT